MKEGAAISKRGYDDSWPPVRGDYVVGDPERGVAVVTLASSMSFAGAAISGPCKTENLGIEKIIANVVSNCNIRFLILCGAESKGHLPGNTILALHKNGIDEQGRIIGSLGAIPFIQNLPVEAVLRFQEQVEMVDRIGLEDESAIEALIERYQALARPFPKMPFQAVRRAAAKPQIQAKDGDLFLGNGVVVDTAAWLALSEG
jgi:tetrahydromethanopterin S-methyltransferase subunit A